MGLFRSEEMTLCQLFLQSEASYSCIAELGELGLVQFRDLNPEVNAFQRKFVNEVRRCDEMERKLRYLEKEICLDEIPILDTGEDPEPPAPREMIDLEATFEKLDNEMREVNSNAEALKKNFLELTELKHILRKTQTFFEEALLYTSPPRHTPHRNDYYNQAVSDGSIADEHANLLGSMQTSDSEVCKSSALRLGFLAGVIDRERIPSFERMLWRVCHGNVFLKQAEIETPLEDPIFRSKINKNVFIIFFQGDQLKSRVEKICEGFRATLYPCPETPQERRDMSIGVMTRIDDLTTVLAQTQDHRHRVLVAAAKNIKVWFIKVFKIKAIYHTLNQFNLDVTQKCLIGECWCPVEDLDRIQLSLRRGTEHSGGGVPSILNRMSTSKVPPTFNRTNIFTSVFQSIVDAYGVARYQEINPAPFTIISFPFLFAVMFGDIGHGFIMLAFAAWMVINEKKFISQNSDNEIWEIFFAGRYVILLMAIFSIYTGSLYNDCFAKSLNIFGSHWTANYTVDAKTPADIQMDPNYTYSGSPYPYGLDPVWQLSKNKILFLNSFKMKLSVILGISQMVFGLILSLYNHRFRRDWISIKFEFIPQMIFLLSIFGYLIILIITKWIFCTSTSEDQPSLLIHLINMFLMSYTEEKGNPGRVFYTGQKFIQTLLLLLALCCIPVILLGKPYKLKKQHEEKQRLKKLLSTQHVEEYTDEDPITLGVGVTESTITLTTDEPEPEFDFGDIMIHQTIHTIEYCLNCISHTASYLRLWALSLAHAELSEVLWNMVLSLGLGIGSKNPIVGPLAIFIVFAPWAILTVTILLLMEGLSAFLHTLRLHWVEFQSKFYGGDGHLFQPFTFVKSKNSTESSNM